MGCGAQAPAIDTLAVHNVGTLSPNPSSSMRRPQRPSDDSDISTVEMSRLSRPSSRCCSGCLKLHQANRGGAMRVGQITGDLLRLLLRHKRSQQDEEDGLPSDPKDHVPPIATGSAAPLPSSGSCHVSSVQRKPISPAFRMAILTGGLESVRFHLRSAGDVHAADEKGRSPLILAASKGRLDVCRVLLEEGADPAIRDQDGNDAIVVARSRGHAEIAAFLLASIPIPPVECCRAELEPEFASDPAPIADRSSREVDGSENRSAADTGNDPQPALLRSETPSSHNSVLPNPAG